MKSKHLTGTPVYMDATRHIPSDPSTAVTSNPSLVNARVSLPEPQPRSRTLAPGASRLENLPLRSDTSPSMVDAE